MSKKKHSVLGMAALAAAGAGVAVWQIKAVKRNRLQKHT